MFLDLVHQVRKCDTWQNRLHIPAAVLLAGWLGFIGIFSTNRLYRACHGKVKSILKMFTSEYMSLRDID